MGSLHPQSADPTGLRDALTGHRRCVISPP